MGHSVHLDTVTTKVTVTDHSYSNNHDNNMNPLITNDILKHPGLSSAQGEQQLPALSPSSGTPVDLNQGVGGDKIYDIPTMSPGNWDIRSRIS